MIVYLATTNSGKIREFETASENLLQFLPLPGTKDLPAPEETGKTFEENAILKANYYSLHTTGLVISEDSGLSVDALDGAPGIYSARYAGVGATDEDNNRRLLEQMAAQENRRARYVCVIALAREGRSLATFRGEVEGELLKSPCGDGGFGYDPIFYYSPFNRTFAEVSRESKQTVSHRGRAIAALMDYLRRHSSPAADPAIRR